LQRQKEAASAELENEKVVLERKKKTINDPKNLYFIFGLNVNNRAADGLFIYNCNRLILMYEHTKLQKSDKKYRGIVGIVNVPYLVLEPTHNKQAFADSKEQQLLINALGEYMDQYLRDVEENLNFEFWKSFGYLYQNDFHTLPSDEDVYKRKRLQSTGILLQCDSCLKWRKIQWNRRLMDSNFIKDDWQCSNNFELGKDK
jgi:hypothetical protein